eukprot:TRINITY_DN1049_c1_g1_i2.p1 TRINITY_DN1049_c1_g1~~TRINITY_DN1049_c1_g1_i2.p1  ORF type:complete len:512 (-),score=109.26 TRINITY_DN1049_c1_g1_i2:397-1932(-)
MMLIRRLRVPQSSSSRFYSSGVGFVGLPIKRPQDWRDQAYEAEKETKQILSTIKRQGSSFSPSNFVKLMDKMSDVICKINDPAQLYVNSGSDSAMAEAASDALSQLQHAITLLNSDKDLYHLSQNFIKQKNELSEEEFKVLDSLITEFEHGGVHLSQQQQQILYKLKDYDTNLRNSYIQLCKPNTQLSDKDRKKAQDLMNNIIAYRLKTAELLGFQSYLEMSAWQRQLKTPQEVESFLTDALSELIPHLTKEFEDNKNMILSTSSSSSSTKSKLTEYSPEVSQYFHINNVLFGLFDLYSSLFGIHFKVVQMDPHEGWHPSVIKVEVLHPELNSKIGIIYMDLFSRSNKLHGAATFVLRLSSIHHPHPTSVGLVCNFPVNTTRTLSFSDSQVLFHEFGHVMHSILAKNKLQHKGGGRSYLDIVEIPSTLMEVFFCDHRVLSRFAKHYKTGEILPENYLKQILENRNRDKASRLQTQLNFCVIDMLVHGRGVTTDKSNIVVVIVFFQLVDNVL